MWLSRGGPAWLQGELLCRSVKPSNKVAEEVAAKKYHGTFITDNCKLERMAFMRNAYEVLGPRFGFPVTVALDIHDSLGHERYLSCQPRRDDRHVGATVDQRRNVSHLSGW